MATGCTHRSLYCKNAPEKSEAMALPPPSVMALCIHPGPDLEKYHLMRAQRPLVCKARSSAVSRRTVSGSPALYIGRACAPRPSSWEADLICCSMMRCQRFSTFTSTPLRAADT